MQRDHFSFKQFKIFHDKCAMKVGTDGVLLGAWCNVLDVRKALDIGTGSGLIAIMLAQRNRDCVIDAVEIDETAYNQALENIAGCPWNTRINVHHSSFQDFSQKNHDTYDLIVSNPPYFQNSLPNPSPDRSAARHAHSLPIRDMINGVKKLLNPGGRYCMIMPVPEARIFVEQASVSGLFCRAVTAVLPNPGKPPKRYLLEFNSTQGDITNSEIIIELEIRHNYSNEFKKLTEDFYLYFRY